MDKNRDVKGGLAAKLRLAMPVGRSENAKSGLATPVSIKTDARLMREKALEPLAFPRLEPEPTERVQFVSPQASVQDLEAAPVAPVAEQPASSADDAPTFLGVLVAIVWYSAVWTFNSIGHITDANEPLTISVRSLSSRIYQLIQPFAWTFLPLAVIFALQLNGHLYYNVFYGYDMPQHFNNTYSVVLTGAMPPAPMTPSTYEAFQAPLYYILTAWVMKAGDYFTSDSMRQVMPAFLLFAAMLWSLLAAALIHRTMHRAHWVLRALTLLVIMLFPMNVQLSVMFNNDLPLTVLGFWGAFTLWLMLRSGRLLDRGRWLRAAAIIGLCIAFKSNGSILMVVYVLLAVYACGLYIRDHRLALATRVAKLALVGLPLMAAPLLLDIWHSSGFGTNLMGSQSEQYNLFSAQNIQFFTTFDTTIFKNPFGYGSGIGSYWTQQYITLHNDYLHFWISDAYQSWPPESMTTQSGYALMPSDQFDTAVTLQYFAILVTLVMAFAFFYALYRSIKKPHLALRDGSVVVVLVAVVSEGALLAAFYSYAVVPLAVIQSRHLGFLYAFLFVTGMAYLWKLVLRRRNLYGALLSAFLSLNMLAYSFFAFKLMWLPPTF